MKTKYDWSGVPKEVKWIATDEDLNSWGFVTNDKPFVGGEDGDQWTSNYFAHSCKHVGFRIFKGNWQDSLEERPSE